MTLIWPSTATLSRPWYPCPDVKELNLSTDPVVRDGITHYPLIYTVQCLAAGGETMCAEALNCGRHCRQRRVHCVWPCAQSHAGG